MKFLIALCLVSVAVAVPVYEDGLQLRYDNDNIGTGPYSYNFEAWDGFGRKQVGELVNDAEVKPWSEVIKDSNSKEAPEDINTWLRR